MAIRLLVGAGLAMTLLSSPVSLARYSTDLAASSSKGSAETMQASYSQTATNHMLGLVAMLARPAPALTPGAPVLTQEGIAVGRIEEVVVHRTIIQAVMSLPSSAIASKSAHFAAEPTMILVPATAFATETGQAVLAIPVEQLSHMERFVP
ncbi:MAG: hypothetical protein AAF221_05140 [Pseudomonadota bacterium]